MLTTLLPSQSQAITRITSMPEFTIEKSYRYEEFKFMKGNRAVNPFNLKRIIDSMSKNPLISPIAVNEKMEIIDGQHRFLAQKELGLPIYFYRIDNYGVNEVHILNTNSSNWKKMDYLQGYCDLGLRPYMQLREFLEQFPDFGIESALHILKVNQYERVDKDTNARKKYFENGNLLIPNIEHSRGLAKKVLDYKPFYKQFNRRSFIIGVVSVIEHQNYNHNEMMAKLSRIPNQIQDQTTAMKYKMHLEDIYNYRRKDKVTLRY